MSKRLFILLTIVLISTLSYLTYSITNQRGYIISVHIERLFGLVAGSTKDLFRTDSLRESLNVFSIRPQSTYLIKAPSFELLPLTKKPLEIITSKANQFLSPVSNLNNSSKDNQPLILIEKNIPEKSIVNIFCSQKIGNLRRIITGSGTVIHKDGTVLTNAHVGQFPLLSESNPNISCMARYGSPAQGSLSVKTAYISPEWINSFGKYINTDGAPQTGKSDFAILKIEMPKSGLYPIQISTSPELTTQSNILSLSYPANILGKNGAYSSLYSQKESLSIRRVYSVGTIEYDIIETSPSTSGQKGSSGGALLDQDGKQIGLIATVVDANGSKTLIRALTIGHIENELLRQSGYTFKGIVSLGSSDLMKSFTENGQKGTITSLLNTYLNSR